MKCGNDKGQANGNDNENGCGNYNGEAGENDKKKDVTMTKGRQAGTTKRINLGMTKTGVGERQRDWLRNDRRLLLYGQSLREL